jgi:PucR C-terminal helix-turn-helix domain/GGDEF-like domain
MTLEEGGCMDSISEEERNALLVALNQRRSEIDERVLARVRAIRTEGVDFDLQYSDGLRLAILAAIDHSLEACGGERMRSAAVPDAVSAQARLAAHKRVPLQVVLRRYLAGHSILGDFVVEEATRQKTDPSVLRDILHRQAVAGDRALSALSSIYSEEVDGLRKNRPGNRRAEQVRRLLKGDLAADRFDLPYDLSRWHIGVAASSDSRTVQRLATAATSLNTAKLIVPAEGGMTWAWLGFREKPNPDALMSIFADPPGDGTSVAIGEAGLGLGGWRLTHEQACAALSVALRYDEAVTRYADVALVASAMGDELLAASLRSLYLDPLREGGAPLRDTLRAYLAANLNVTSTAAALGVSRNTVTKRLRGIEERVGSLEPRRITVLSVALQFATVLSASAPAS